MRYQTIWKINVKFLPPIIYLGEICRETKKAKKKIRDRRI